MSEICGSGDQVGRGPCGPPSRATLESPAGQRLLAEIFVRRWLEPSRRTVDLQWVKVYAEHAMGYATGQNGYVWIRQDVIEAALVSAGYRVRFGHVKCQPVSRDLHEWRFFKRGGKYR